MLQFSEILLLNMEVYALSWKWSVTYFRQMMLECITEINFWYFIMLSKSKIQRFNPADIKAHHFIRSQHVKSTSQYHNPISLRSTLILSPTLLSSLPHGFPTNICMNVKFFLLHLTYILLQSWKWMTYWFW